MQPSPHQVRGSCRCKMSADGGGVIARLAVASPAPICGALFLSAQGRDAVRDFSPLRTDRLFVSGMSAPARRVPDTSFPCRPWRAGRHDRVPCAPSPGR